ncbi:hypothetical protein M422DRAFT_52769 [Sphaerobolus stellatus SS14]|uniref:DUF6534 domain-containing protein n=1 Tax=Sphaerobolus stellatus (strain SS14) TaxID=990650 RepID=A0A0C9UD16_SPHS4|nr:hypothetical protein M422DRAFT_52769 [Sphaerobolus stellatus SS14]
MAAVNPDFNSFRGHINAIGFDTWLIVTAIADTLIAVCLSYLLLAGSGKSMIRSSTAIQSIVRVIVETNSISAGVAIISIVLYFALPDTNYFICPYSNALMMTFNNRALLAKKSGNITATSASRFFRSQSRAVDGSIHSPRRRGMIIEEITPNYNEATELESFSLSLHKENPVGSFPQYPDPASARKVGPILP